MSVRVEFIEAADNTSEVVGTLYCSGTHLKPHPFSQFRRSLSKGRYRIEGIEHLQPVDFSLGDRYVWCGTECELQDNNLHTLCTSKRRSLPNSRNKSANAGKRRLLG